MGFVQGSPPTPLFTPALFCVSVGHVCVIQSKQQGSGRRHKVKRWTSWDGGAWRIFTRFSVQTVSVMEAADTLSPHSGPQLQQRANTHTVLCVPPWRTEGKEKKSICRFFIIYNLKIPFPHRQPASQPAAFLTLSRLFSVPSSVWINGHCLTLCLCGVSQCWSSEHVSGSRSTLH